MLNMYNVMPTYRILHSLGTSHEQEIVLGSSAQIKQHFAHCKYIYLGELGTHDNCRDNGTICKAKEWLLVDLSL